MCLNIDATPADEQLGRTPTQLEQCNMKRESYDIAFLAAMLNQFLITVGVDYDEGTQVLRSAQALWTPPGELRRDRGQSRPHPMQGLAMAQEEPARSVAANHL